MKTFANSCVKLTSFYWLVSYSPKEVPQTLPRHCQSPPIHAVKTTDLKRENDTFPMLRKSEKPTFLNWVAPLSSWAIYLFTARPHSRERTGELSCNKKPEFLLPQKGLMEPLTWYIYTKSLNSSRIMHQGWVNYDSPHSKSNLKIYKALQILGKRVC